MPVVILVSTFKNKTTSVWHSSEVASVNALLVSSNFFAPIARSQPRAKTSDDITWEIPCKSINSKGESQGTPLLLGSIINNTAVTTSKAQHRAREEESCQSSAYSSAVVAIFGLALMLSEEYPKNAVTAGDMCGLVKQCLVGLSVTVAEYGTARELWKATCKSVMTVENM